MDIDQPASANGSAHMTLARVKHLLTSTELSSAYTPESPLTAADLAAWETANGVVLPEAYRLFLLEIGNGGSMPGSYCDFEMKPLKSGRSDSRLREPFPITSARLKERMAQLRIEGRGSASLFPELEQYMEDGEPPGCLHLGHYPSYDMLYLVVSGELHGSIWCMVDNGVPEFNQQGEPFDFLEWFEDTLLDLGGLK